jgi:hypothetical protein
VPLGRIRAVLPEAVYQSCRNQYRVRPLVDGG